MKKSSIAWAILICILVFDAGIHLTATVRKVQNKDFGSVSFSDLKELSGFDRANVLEEINTTEGQYVDCNSGKVCPLKDYSVTDFFRVRSGVSYDLTYHSSGSQIAFYDKDKDFVTGFPTGSDTLCVPDDDTIVYARWCGETATRSTWGLYIRQITNGRICYIDPSIGILEGIIDAYETGAKKIIVMPGEYDIIEEYEHHFGEDYFKSYSPDYNNLKNGWYDAGIPLDDVDILFESGTHVSAHYKGSNENVKVYFSAFSVFQDVTIDGLVLDASELRYGLHPDFHEKNTEYMTIKNCDLHHYKSSSSKDNNNQAIGAGLGVHSTWTIENCIFRSDTYNPVLKIHNNNSEESESKIIIKDCYIEGNGYIALNSYSTSTRQTIAQVSGCSWKTPVAVGKESPDSNNNITLYEWNNETRQ